MNEPTSAPTAMAAPLPMSHAPATHAPDPRAPDPRAPADTDLAALLMARAQIAADETPAAALARILDEQERLRPLADDGRRYRVDLITAALAEGVRAYGDGFAADTYRSVLTTAPLDVIQRMRVDWQAVGDARFTGGRATIDGADATPAPVTAHAIPDAAYRS